MAGIPSASLLENARFNALVIVPNAVQGISRRRRAPVAAASRANVDGHAVGLLSGMYRHHHGGPVWVRVMRDRALLLLTGADVNRALAGSPDPFAADPEAKRKGMVTFQPDALTISRGDLWRNRRRFTEAVLDTGAAVHRHADRFDSVAREEAGAMIGAADSQSSRELTYDPWNRTFLRISRRVILGDSAADDDELSETLAEMMSEANGMPGAPSPRYGDFVARLGEYVAAAEEGSLVSLFGEAPADARTKQVGQIPHWMFASGDTLANNAFRAAALIASHPAAREAVERELAADGSRNGDGGPNLAYIGACLEEAMRLYPTTTMLARETLAETEWRGSTVPAGTQVLIPNTFLHRDRDRLEYADRFAPERWVSGEAASELSFNHFSRGPQGCPGASLALELGKAVLAELFSEPVELVSPSIDPRRPLPHMLDFFGIRLRVSG